MRIVLSCSEVSMGQRVEVQNIRKQQTVKCLCWFDRQTHVADA